MSGFPPGALMTSDSLPPGGSQWGIFDQYGNSVLTADSVFSLEYARDYRISDYPQEQGAFESYNKVQTPFSAKLTFLIEQTRPDFLSTIEDIAKGTEPIVSVLTPDVTYDSANIVHYGYRRQKENADLVLVDVWVEEVRIVATSATFNTQQTNTPDTSNGQSPNSAPTAQNGNQVPTPPTTAQDVNISNAQVPGLGG